MSYGELGCKEDQQRPIDIQEVISTEVVVIWITL